MDTFSKEGKMKPLRNRLSQIFLLFLISFFLLSFSTQAQMVNPSMDKPEEPFSYFSYPTDVIGLMDCREGTEITPEGYLYTGYGELMFFHGNPPRPVNQRVKTLHKGYLPIIEYSFEDEGVQYSLTLFAYTLDGTPETDLVNFIRVEFQNSTQNPRTVFWTVGTRYTAGSSDARGIPDHRFRRPAAPSRVGQYEQEGEEFSPEWEYTFEDGLMLRGGQVFYLFPADIPHTKWTTLNTPYDIRWKKPYITPTTPVGLARFKITLKPRESKSLDLKMPYRPLSPSDAALDSVKKADFDDYFLRAADFWENILSQGMRISLPEEKVVNTFKANLVYDLIARDKIGDDYVQKVNEFQYDAFWLRDSSYIVRAYDVTGYPKIAEQCLNFFLEWQTEDGNFLSQNGQYDGWGQSLWAIGQHYLITRDHEFARKFFPAVEKAMSWLTRERKNDPLRIMPITTPGDNELITGHVTGHNFWALAGIDQVIAMAQNLGETEKAKEFSLEYDDYRQHFIKALKAITEKSAGYIPPGLDELGGQDWGNLMAVYPVQILPPLDPLVTKTLEVSRSKYREGIMTYWNQEYLHLYLTMKNTETEVIRGEQEKVLSEFYSLLVHTSSTQAGFEWSIRAWGDRDFGRNLTPHGWFAAKFRTLLRNMLVREEEQTLHLCSVLSPHWIREGQRLEVMDAPTNFGKIGFSLAFEKDKAHLKLDPQFREEPEEIILHIPWFAEVRDALADGQKIQAEEGVLHLSPGTKEVILDWTLTPVGAMSYDHFVQEYKEEYRTRYKEFLEKGEKENHQ
jgi:hypothetical protein